jgi:hypothetical protein
MSSDTIHPKSAESFVNGFEKIMYAEMEEENLQAPSDSKVGDEKTAAGKKIEYILAQMMTVTGKVTEIRQKRQEKAEDEEAILKILRAFGAWLYLTVKEFRETGLETAEEETGEETTIPKSRGRHEDE